MRLLVISIQCVVILCILRIQYYIYLSHNSNNGNSTEPIANSCTQTHAQLLEEQNQTKRTNLTVRLYGVCVVTLEYASERKKLHHTFIHIYSHKRASQICTIDYMWCWCMCVCVCVSDCVAMCSTLYDEIACTCSLYKYLSPLNPNKREAF